MDKETLLEELKNNPKCIAYLAKFTESSADNFLEYYASEKATFLERGKFLRDRQLSNEAHFRNRAEKFYWQIAQKKLFNLQCQWRAGQIDLPVEVSIEFHYWEKNIKACPFNDPVTSEDLEVMLKFLKKPHSDTEEYLFEEWQDYDGYKSQGEFGAEYPDWYEFYDNHMGTHLLSLPNIRGAEEERYLDAWRAEKFKDYKEPPKPEKPDIFYDSETTLAFIKAVEPYKILDFYRMYDAYRNEANTFSDLHEIWDILSREEEEVVVPQGRFPEVLYETLHQLQAKKMERLLPMVMQENEERKAMGISYPVKGKVEDDDLVKMLREGIKRGKQLLGEE